MSTTSIANILIVDDQPDIIDAITGYLKGKANGFKFLQAINGQMACKVAEKRLPDLIIMDWEMPLMNGYEALLALKNNPITEQIPVIMATGRSSPEDLDKALNAGAADFIRKPIEKQELLARVRTCLKLSRYIQEIKSKNDKLLDLNREKDGLVNMVAHDLRSPLCSIFGYVELIKSEGMLNQNQNLYLSTIDREIQDGMYLIDDLLYVHSNEFDAPKLELVEINMKEYIEEWVKTFEQQLKKKDQKLHIEVSVEHTQFKTDQLVLTRILNNLLSNAIKFSQNKTSIYITIRDTGLRFDVSVRDEGPGISMDDQKMMFKRFQKLTARPTNGESSNGLGLSIIKTLVEKLKGDIVVNSELGKGTEFIIKLPKTGVEDRLIKKESI